MNVSNIHKKTKTIRFGCVDLPLFLANTLFAFAAVGGQIGVYVSLPLWIDSSNKGSSNFTSHSNTTVSQQTVDSYFVLTFSCLSFVVIYGFSLVLTKIFYPYKIGATERDFPHLLLFLIGMCDALNGVLVVFASSGKRTAPYLQAILGNMSIPMILFVR